MVLAAQAASAAPRGHQGAGIGPHPWPWSALAAEHCSPPEGPLRFHPTNSAPGEGGEATPVWPDRGPGEVSYVTYWSHYIYFSLAVKCRHEGWCWVQWAATMSGTVMDRGDRGSCAPPRTRLQPGPLPTQPQPAGRCRPRCVPARGSPRQAGTATVSSHTLPKPEAPAPEPVQAPLRGLPWPGVC